MSGADPVGTRPARRADVRSVGTTYTAAFLDDPVLRRIVSDVRRWWRGIPHFFRVTALDHLATMWVTSGLASAAAWVPPGHRVDRWHEARHGPGLLAVSRSRSLMACGSKGPCTRSSRRSPTGTSICSAPILPIRVGAAARPCSSRPSTGAMTRICRRTSSHRRRPTSLSTGVMASRSAASSVPWTGARRSGRCGAGRAEVGSISNGNVTYMNKT